MKYKLKGVILAAGPGEELKPLTSGILKPMIRILDKTLIEFAIDRLLHSGITDICIVIPENDRTIKNHIDSLDLKAEFSYLQQEEEGIEGAIKAVENLFDREDQFILTHADIVTNNKIVTRTLNAADNSGAEMAIAVALQSETQDFGQVTLDSNGFVDQVIPTTDVDSSHYVVAGTFLLTGKIFDYLNQGIPFNQCFNQFIEEGGQVVGGIWNETWIDVGRPWDVLRATYYRLDKLESSYIAADVEIGPNVELIGPVYIEKGVKILNGTILKGPVFIGKNAFIGNNSLIRDHSAIYANAKIGMGVEVRSSVIQQSASIARLSYVGASIVCEKATMHSGTITINTNTPPSPIFTQVQGERVEVPLKKFGAVIGPNAHIGVHSSLKPGTVVAENVIVEPHQIIDGWVSE